MRYGEDTYFVRKIRAGNFSNDDFKIINNVTQLLASITQPCREMYFEGILTTPRDDNLMQAIKNVGLLCESRLSNKDILFIHALQKSFGSLNKAYIKSCLSYYKKQVSFWEKKPPLINELKVLVHSTTPDSQLIIPLTELLKPYIDNLAWWLDTSSIKQLLLLLAPFATLDTHSSPHLRRNVVSALSEHVIDSQGKSISLIDQNLAEEIWKRGLASWHDYRRIRLLNGVQLNKVLFKLESLSLIFTGSPCEDNAYQDQVPAKKVENYIRQGKVLVKIIKEKNWVNFLKQLADYNYRPGLRKPIDKEKTATHKFFHVENEAKRDIVYTYRQALITWCHARCRCYDTQNVYCLVVLQI